MRLSEAIRLGAMLSPQAHWGYTGHPADIPVNPPPTCAIGAALLAVGKLAEVLDIDTDLSHAHVFPALNRLVMCPVDHGLFAMDVIIVGLNDGEYWSREAIADWVATVEMAESVEPVESASTVADAIAATSLVCVGV